MKTLSFERTFEVMKIGLYSGRGLGIWIFETESQSDGNSFKKYFNTK